MAGKKQTMMLNEVFKSEEIQVPYIEISGAAHGPTLAVVAGIHGAEYAGIEAAIRLSQQVDPEALHGRLRIVPICNMPGFLKGFVSSERGIYHCHCEHSSSSQTCHYLSSCLLTLLNLKNC